jgi:hypothetical protein
MTIRNCDAEFKFLRIGCDFSTYTIYVQYEVPENQSRFTKTIHIKNFSSHVIGYSLPDLHPSFTSV